MPHLFDMFIHQNVDIAHSTPPLASQKSDFQIIFSLPDISKQKRGDQFVKRAQGNQSKVKLSSYIVVRAA